MTFDPIPVTANQVAVIVRNSDKLFIPTADIVDALNLESEIATRRAIQMKVSNVLAPHAIRPHTRRVGSKVVNGYYKGQFDGWEE